MPITVGEIIADFLNSRLGLGVAATWAVMALTPAVALVARLWARRYVPVGVLAGGRLDQHPVGRIPAPPR
ncbi:hypothetical protein [Micromonospora sp. NPDC004551]|uniref:hypothetical protein n=1 Tax=Micromonospora sp. NPDC004551 TaxID=3154284 RepID=UPI0033B29891